MLHPDQIGRFLLHENPYVRDHALWTLSQAESHGGVSADVALDAIGKYGADAFWDTERIMLLPMSETAMARLIAAAADDPFGIAEAMEKLPQATLKQYATRLPRNLREPLAFRLELGELSAEKLWAELDPLEDNALEHLALVEHDEFVAPRIMAILSRANDPMQYIAIELAGLCHIGSALPLLLDRFAVNDIAAEMAIEAVARLGTAGAVTAIEQRCARGDASFRSAAADCMGRIRVPSVEPALQRLMIEEDDEAVLGDIVRAMADICTTTNFDAICQIVRSGRGASEVGSSAKRSLGALAIMLGRPLAESDAWLVGRPRGGKALAIALGASDTEEVQLPPAHTGEVQWANPPEKPAPIRRAQTKVGRNDPCPCGSGKKYKKCCGA